MVQNMRLISRRREVQWFSCEMEAVLRANDHKGGWHGEDAGWLVERLREEVDELAKALDAHRAELASRERYVAKTATVIREAADVANFAMMIADVCRT